MNLFTVSVKRHHLSPPKNTRPQTADHDSLHVVMQFLTTCAANKLLQ